MEIREQRIYSIYEEIEKELLTEEECSPKEILYIVGLIIGGIAIGSGYIMLWVFLTFYFIPWWASLIGGIGCLIAFRIVSEKMRQCNVCGARNMGKIWERAEGFVLAEILECRKCGNIQRD